MTDPMRAVVAALEEKGLRVRAGNGGFTAQCPAHEDAHPSLSVSEGDDGRALVHCHAGCSFEDVLAALGMDPSDVFNERLASAHVVPNMAPPKIDLEALWEGMSLRDSAGEQYLDRRGLLVDPLPTDVVRFNTGRTGDPFIDFAAQKGFGIAFAVRNAAGTIASLSFRHLGGGAEWSGEIRAKLSMKGCPTVGIAIARPEVPYLASRDPEFLRDEVILCEGGTDWLAATITNDIGALENVVPPAWVLGCIGVSNAASVVKAFAPVIAGRVLRLWFDSDDAGHHAAETAAGVAVDVGARTVLRYEPVAKDVANDLERSAG